jgi:hypothetical protein
VGGGVLEHRHLLVLRRDIHDRVPHQVDQRERAVETGRGHVADRDLDLAAPRLASKLFDHVGRQLDAVHPDSPGGEGQRHPARAHREFERRSIARQLG